MSAEQTVTFEWTDRVTEYYRAQVPVSELLAAVNAHLAPGQKPYTVDDIEGMTLANDSLDVFLADLSGPANERDTRDTYREMELIVVEPLLDGEEQGTSEGES